VTASQPSTAASAVVMNVANGAGTRSSLRQASCRMTFAGPGSTGDQHVRHLGQIGQHGPAQDALAVLAIGSAVACNPTAAINCMASLA